MEHEPPSKPNSAHSGTDIGSPGAERGTPRGAASGFKGQQRGRPIGALNILDPSEEPRQGFVINIKDSFGFILPVDAKHSQLFFHVSALDPPALASDDARVDLRAELNPGDGVEFLVQASKHEPGKIQAVRVRKLPSGTLKREYQDPQRRRGIVRSFFAGDLYIVPARPEDNHMNGLNEPLGKLKFSAKANVRPGSRVPQPGDIVEFAVVVDRMKHTLRASDIEVLAQSPSSTDLKGAKLGRIVQLTAGGGVLETTRGERVDFSSAEPDVASELSKLTIDCEVAYFGAEGEQEQRGHNGVRGLRLLPPGTLEAQHREGVRRGVIAQLPNGGSSGCTGRLTYSEGGSPQEAEFGLKDVADFVPSLSVGDRVEFELVRHKLTAESSVQGITLLLKATQAAELGRVSVLKKNFGFIRCCDRISDMFFHIDAFKATSEMPSVGADVRFVPALDQDTGKVFATEVEVVLAGTAVFEVIGPDIYMGTVKVAAGLVSRGGPGSQGIVVAHINGVIEMLPFKEDDVLGDQPEVDAKVAFQVLEDRRQVTAVRRNGKAGKQPRSGRRAVAVKQVQVGLGAECAGPEASSRAATMSPRRKEAMCVQGDGTESQPGAHCLGVVAAAPGELCSPVAVRTRRLRGSVQRIVRSKRLPTGAALGIVRNSAFDGWTHGKRNGASGAANVDPASMAFLHAKGIQCHLVHGDHIFWLSEVCADHSGSLAKQDEVEYSIAPRRVQDDDTLVCEMAVDIVRVRAARPVQTQVRWAPPQPSASQPAQVRRAPKFLGSSAVVVPGPAKGAIGFQAGRGKPFSEDKARVSQFRLEEAVKAPAFIPSCTSFESFRTCLSSCELPVQFTEAAFDADQFDDSVVQSPPLSGNSNV